MEEALSTNYIEEYRALSDEKEKATEVDDSDYVSIQEKYKQDLIRPIKKVLES